MKFELDLVFVDFNSFAKASTLRPGFKKYKPKYRGFLGIDIYSTISQFIN